MPTFTLHNNSLEYEPSDVINFAEGLIGLPGLRRLALVRQPEIDPFLWLAALAVDGMAFLVVEPRALFPDYELPEYDVIDADRTREIKIGADCGKGIDCSGNQYA